MSETEPLLEHQEDQEIILEEGNLSLPSAIFSLLKTAIGAGMLYLPYVFKEIGLISGTCLLLFAGITTGLSLHLLSVATNIHQNGKLAKLSMGRKGEILTVVSILFFLYAPLLMYLSLAGEYISKFAIWILGTNYGLYTSTKFIVLILTILLYPLCCVKNLSKLGIVSVVGLIFLLYVVGLTCYDLAVNSVSPTVKLYNWTFAIFGCFAKVLMSYMSHINLPDLCQGLQIKSAGRSAALVSVTSIVATILYLVFCICAYLLFGELVAKDVLETRYPLPALYHVGRIAVALVNFFSIPLLTRPTRFAIDWLYVEMFQKSARKSGSADQRAFFEIFLIFLAVTPIAMYFVQSVAVVLEYSGSVFGSLLIFILPSGIYLNLPSGKKTWEMAVAYFNVVLVVILMIGGIASQFI